MVNRQVFFGSLIFLFVITSIGQAKEWRGIIPLHSTRADVERLLGKPNAHYGRYLIENEEADILYSKGRCANGWDVPEDTVINIAITYKGTRRLSDFDLDLTKYKKFNDPLTTNHGYYVNRDAGIRYVVVDEANPGKEQILTVYYESTSADERRLFCKQARATFPRRASCLANIRTKTKKEK